MSATATPRMHFRARVVRGRPMVTVYDQQRPVIDIFAYAGDITGSITTWLPTLEYGYYSSRIDAHDAKKALAEILGPIDFAASAAARRAQQAATS